MAKMQKKRTIEAISEGKGNLSEVARILKVGRSTVYDYLNKYPDLWEYVDAERERTLDHLERKAIDIALKGDTRMLQLLLKTQGKKRGYVERQETDITSKGNEIFVTITGNDD